jgi:catechol 2,3-dioxygenase-like lactoylglutathione lyase family enzyme
MQVDQIDHVEIEVPNRYEAARWYQAVLGFEICREYEFWAEPGSGPLMISTDGGKTKLALFDGTPQGADRPIGIRRIAFRVDGEQFSKFIEHLDAMRGTPAVRRSEIIDHEKSFSVYFEDPYGNRLEITTYDYNTVRNQLEIRENRVAGQ